MTGALPPAPGFADPEDWRESLPGLDVPPTIRSRARILADDADAEHDGRHTDHAHPWCERCEIRDRAAQRPDLEVIPTGEAERRLRAATDGKIRDLPHWLLLAAETAYLKDTPLDVDDIGEDVAAALLDWAQVSTAAKMVRATTESRALRYLIRNNGRLPDPRSATRVVDVSSLYLDADQLDQLPTPEPLIDRVLNRHSYAILSGRDGVGKSFIALDWSCCLATGRRWQGRDVDPVRVLYVAGEGAFGLQQRKVAWEQGWNRRVPPEMLTVRAAAVDLFKGGAPLDELLARVTDGEYGLVVIDTLRRASGRADGNSSDMGVVVDNLDLIKRATDEGSVLVIAHTGKDDGDSRGFSGIEDDADIVWHVKKGDQDRHAMAVDLECRKMKDGPDGERIELALDPVLDSLVVSAHARPHWPGPVDNRDTDNQLLDAMRESFAITGATASQLLEVTGMPRATLYKARGRLLHSGQLITKRKSGADYLHLPEPVWIPVGPVHTESTPGPTAASTPVHTATAHDSTPVHTRPRVESTPVHTCLAPLIGGEGVDTVDETPEEVAS